MGGSRFADQGAPCISSQPVQWNISADALHRGNVRRSGVLLILNASTAGPFNGNGNEATGNRSFPCSFAH
jgi:hypothetical protein